MTLSIRNLKLEPDINIPDAEAQFRPKVETQRRDDLQYSSLAFFRDHLVNMMRRRDPT